MLAKDIGEVMQLQSEFLRSQFGIATEQLKKTTGEAAKLRLPRAMFQRKIPT
jgi:hypothetical protein